MEVISENNNKESNQENTNDLNVEGIPKLSLEEPSFQLITKEQEKKDKEDQSFLASEKSDINNPKSKNEKSTEDNSVINISKIIKSTESNERKSSINLNIEEIKEEKSGNKKSKRKKNNMNNPPPEVYLGENIVRKVYNINPMEIKLKRMEKEIESQYNYDYNKAMQEIKEKIEKDKKKEEQIKHIQEQDKKLKEKLKNMEEYRENKMKELIKRVEKKQKITRKNKNNKNILSSNKSALSSKNYIQTTINNENSENIRKKLPPIANSYDRYKKILEKKENNEKDFILNTEEDLEYIGKEHEENYKNVTNLLNQKIQDRKKLYDERNELYLKNRMQKELEKKERYLEKDMKHRYNVQLTIIKSATEKNGKLQDKIKKNLENFNEKKMVLMEKEKKKVKEYLKKINKYKNAHNNPSNTENNRKYYLEQQKLNINKTNKETEKKYSDLLEKQGYLLGFSYNLEKDDINRKKDILKNNKMMQDENKKIYQNFNEFLEKIEKNNINNKTDKIKMKIYNKKVKEELEEKMRKEEEELKKLGL